MFSLIFFQILEDYCVKTWYLLCKRHRWYHSVRKTHVTNNLKMTQIHASGICQIFWIRWIQRYSCKMLNLHLMQTWVSAYEIEYQILNIFKLDSTLLLTVFFAGHFKYLMKMMFGRILSRASDFIKVSHTFVDFPCAQTISCSFI